MKIELYTLWREKDLVCVCTKDGKCRKERNCELLEFNLNKYDGIEECMKHDSYMRVKSRIQQKR